jgi:hypothetical protein
MPQSSPVETLLPRWTRTVSAMSRGQALVRSQCRVCGIQMREDPAALALQHGPLASLVDRSDRCRIVACEGTIFYLAARTYGRAWILLVSREDLRSRLAQAAPPLNANALQRRRATNADHR